MAGYRGGGGGGGGPSVVPASLVVADDREDYPLTRVGLEDAIAALPAGGGDIYLGAGTLVIDSAVALSKNIRLFGAGVGVTIISVTGAISIFTAGDVNLTLANFSVTGNNTAGQTFLTLTASTTSNKYTFIDSIRIGTDNSFSPDGTRNIFNAATFSRNWIITNFICLNVASGSFYANGGSGFMRLSNVSANGELTNTSMAIEAVNTTIAASGEIDLYRQAKISGCRFNSGTTVTVDVDSSVTGTFLISVAVSVGTDCEISACTIQVATLTVGASSRVSNCAITGAVTLGASSVLSGCSVTTGAVTAGGAGVKVTGCTLESFTSATAGFDEHIITGNTFTGAGDNVTLTDSDGCIVQGNVDCQVEETGSSDGNHYSEISTSSTILGTSSVVTDADRYAWSFPGVLDTATNDEFPRISPQVSTMVRILEANVETAPVGSAITIAIRVGTKATGVLGATIGTITIPDGAFTGQTVVNPAVVLAPTQFIVPEVTAVGSGTPGSSAGITARA